MRKIERAPLPTLLNSDKLIKLLISKELSNLFNLIDEKYYYWDKVKYQELPEGVSHEDIWTIVKLRRMGTPFKINFGKYNFYWNVGSRLQGLLHFLDMNIGGSLESSSIVSYGDKNRYLISSIMEEAIASSQIEGAITTRKKAKEMLRKKVKPKTKSEQMIVNNYISIQHIIEKKNEILTKEKLFYLHKLVTYNTLSSQDEEGFLRTDNDINVVDTTDGSIVHHPPDYVELDFLLNDLIKFFNEDDPDLFIHPLVKAIVIHFMIGFIHPFNDGNGRTARALFYWYLLKKQYWLTEYLSISRLILRSKAQYARAYQYSEIDDNDLTYFLSYNLRAMKLAFDELREYIKRKNEEKKQISNLLGVDGINYKQTQILEWYIHEPTLLLTIKEVETRLGISNASARIDLKQLVEKGYLEVRNINKRTIGFIKTNKLDTARKKGKNTLEKFEIKNQSIVQQSLF